MTVSGQKTSRRRAPFFLVSLVCHAAVVLLIPAVDSAQVGQRTAQGPITVAVLREPEGSTEVGTVRQLQPVAVPQHERPKVTEAPPKPTPPPPPPAKPKPKPAAEVITSPAATEAIPPVEPEKPEIQQPVEEAPPTSIPTEEVPEEPVPEPDPGPPAPPFGSEVVSSLQALKWPQKPAANLRRDIKIPIVVRVSASGDWESSEVLQTSGLPELDSWAIKASRAAFSYKKLDEAYEVRMEVSIDPRTRSVVPITADERVRLIP